MRRYPVRRTFRLNCEVRSTILAVTVSAHDQERPASLTVPPAAELVYTQATSDFGPKLRELELICFPTIDPDDLLTEEEVAVQAEVFPEGAFMVLDGERVVGMASGLFVDYDLANLQHSLDDIVGESGLYAHNPYGAWYYGIDIAVHPQYRGLGIGRRLYELRKQVVKDFNKRGMIAGGVIPGYPKHKHEMSAATYVAAVITGELFDPTLSFQLANGFEALGVIANFVHDDETDGWASFIVWYNPDYDPCAV